MEREQIDRRVEQLLEDPHGLDRGDYGRRSDQWTATYGGVGLLVYALVEVNQALIVLRLL